MFNKFTNTNQRITNERHSIVVSILMLSQSASVFYVKFVWMWVCVWGRVHLLRFNYIYLATTVSLKANLLTSNMWSIHIKIKLWYATNRAYFMWAILMVFLSIVPLLLFNMSSICAFLILLEFLLQLALLDHSFYFLL